jgi:predicted RNA binding protein YcfA (HicA-like mRNA interferase family)
MTGKELLKRLQQDGWQIARIKGSHYIMKKNGEMVSVPFHNTEMRKGTLESILKDAGLK